MSAPLSNPVQSTNSLGKQETIDTKGNAMVGSETMEKQQLSNNSKSTANVTADKEKANTRGVETASEGTMTPPPQEASVNGYSSDNNSVSSSEGAIDVSKMDPATLMIRIKAQVEYYFSAQNLNHDAYMISQMNSEGYIKTAVIAQFKKVKKLTDDVEKIVEAIADSEICSLSEDKTSIKATWKRPARTTIILRDVQEGTKEEDVLKLFDGTDFKIVSARPDVGNTWFVQLDNEESAKEATLHLFSLKLNGQPVKARLKSANVLRSTAPTWQPTGNFAAGASGQAYYGYQQGMGQFNPQVIPGYTATGTWDPRMQYSAQDWPAEQGAQSTSAQGAPQKSPRQGGGNGNARNTTFTASNSKRTVGTKNKGQANKDSNKGNKNKSNSGNSNTSNNAKEGANSSKEHSSGNTGTKSNPAPAKNFQKKEKSGLAASGSSSNSGPNAAASSASGNRKKKNAVNNSSAGSQSLASKKVKTPVFQPQDFPSLPMGKIALEDESPAPAQEAAPPAKTVAAVVAASLPAEAPKPAAPAEKPEPVAKAPVKAAAGAVPSPTPSQPENEEPAPVPKEAAASQSSRGNGTPAAMSTWAAAVAKNAAPRATTSAFKPVGEPKKSAPKPAKAKPQVKPVKEAPEPVSDKGAAADAPRPRRGWEQPGLPQVVPREVKQPKETVQPSPSAPSKKAKGTKERTATKPEKRRTEEEPVEPKPAADDSTTAEPVPPVEPAKGVWGPKSFVQVIKENSDKPVVVSELGDDQESAAIPDSVSEGRRSGNMKFFASTGEHVANLDGNWREQARSRREEEARRRNVSGNH